MDNKFIRVDEVAQELSISKPYAYKLIKKLNDELKEQGFITIAGRVNRQYFQERFYGAGLRKRSCPGFFVWGCGLGALRAASQKILVQLGRSKLHMRPSQQKSFVIPRSGRSPDEESSTPRGGWLRILVCARP